jgi:hypothetical protein
VRGAVLAIGLLAIGGVAGAAVAFDLDEPPERPPASASSAPLPDPVEPAFTPGRPRPLANRKFLSHWASVRHGVLARTLPAEDAPGVGYVETMTPEGTTNVVSVLERAEGSDGDLWVKVGLAALPNGTTGWVPRDALGGYGTVPTHLIVDLEEMTATLMRNGRSIFQARVGVGTTAYPTPTGTFYIRNKLSRYSSPFYGPLAFGTSARSEVLTDWPAGGFVGIHGTNQPELIPGRISHGCIRLSNDDILELGRLMPVGTPLTIS